MSIFSNLLAVFFALRCIVAGGKACSLGVARFPTLRNLYHMAPRGLTKRLLLNVEQWVSFLYSCFKSIYTRQHFMRRFLRGQTETVGRLYKTNRDIQVLAGPFRGMRYFNEVTWGSLVPKWVGTYEMELHPWIRRIVERPPRIVIDVGCAEGFYAVGLARLLPGVRVFAFDVDFISRRQLRKLSRLNGVADQIKVSGWCSHYEVERLTAGGNALLIADIEGHETLLLDPVACPSLASTRILVELHPGVGRTLEDSRRELETRFAGTHRSEQLASVARSAANGKHLLPLGFQAREIPTLLEEYRGVAQSWLLLSPIHRPSHD
jgi:hypothetical protein